MKRTAVLFVCATVAVQVVSAQIRDPRAIKRHRRSIPNSYIVTLSGDDDPDAVGLETATLRRGRLQQVFRHVTRGFAIRLTETEADALAHDPRVAAVEQDAEVRAATLVERTAPWGLDRIDQRRLPLDGAYQYVEPSRAVYVHVIDTGVRVSHVEFGGRAFNQGDFVGDGQNGRDCNGHGTHVAATVAGSTAGVAKNATVLSYRALDCTGTGAISGVIAAIDAATGDGRRPAVANLSISGEASDALDEAVRQSIASGITYVVAAGNEGVDASTRSPARVTEAITVGAVDESDTRADFSNVGSVVDLFAPGVDIDSAWYSSDTATATLSGTSMAAPHVTGVVALFLGANGSKSPVDAAAALLAGSTQGVVVGTSGSPNRLLYSAMVSVSRPLVRVSHPNGAEKVFTATPYTIEWDASDTTPFSRFDVLVSSDNGASFSSVAGCSGLSGSVRSCTWSSPGPATGYAYVKVVATDTAGYKATDVSDGRFSIVAGTASITLTSPGVGTNLARGSLREIKWTHNLGAASYVRVELSRDGGATFHETLGVLRNTTSEYGTLLWRFSGPDTAKAVIRVSWTSGPARDVNAPFTIAEPYVTLSGISYATNWGYGTAQRINWSTNLGPYDLLTARFSGDSGTTYARQLLAGATASVKYGQVIAPSQAAPQSARLRLEWSNAPEGFSASSTSGLFTVAAPTLKLITPDGGEAWRQGSAASVGWTGNLGQEKVRIDLSVDGGSSYGINVSASTTNDGIQAITVGNWVTTKAKARVAWAANPAVADASNTVFQIQ